MKKGLTFGELIKQLEIEFPVSRGTFDAPDFLNKSDWVDDVKSIPVIHYDHLFVKASWIFNDDEILTLRFVIPCYKKNEFIRVINKVLSKLDQRLIYPDLSAIDCADPIEGTIPLNRSIVFSYPDMDNTLFEIKAFDENLIFDIYCHN